MHDDTVPEQLRTFFENSQVALALAAPDGDNPLLLVNSRFSELTGYEQSELAGRNCRILQGEADDQEARTILRAFLDDDTAANVRKPILNFKKDGTPFVNLLYMSRLRGLDGQTRYIFASQFDVSRAQPERLEAYDQELGQTLTRLSPAAAESGIIVEGTLTTIANSARTVAQARLTLADLDNGSFL
ncbi:PAS domain S-box protein [Novosphingobium sp. YJ-S2-02]|uniref:PAS domain S-box protein n=1 Tax=Novosphingobium aureum TaxID=2792964 RepID=A0A931HAU1_9SPHN|nr:PAS domain S-box protein [Novosphingobium aureum]MBH0112587.1 PAS domain S-box protein [Novosphingobium aureum]